MKKVIIYTENYTYGGLEKTLFDIASNLGKERILLMFNKENKRILDFAQKNMIPYIVLPIKNNMRIPIFKNRVLNLIINSIALIKNQYNFIMNYHFLNGFLRNYTDYQNMLIINGGYPAASSCRAAVLAAKKIGIKNVVLSVLSYPQSYFYIKKSNKMFFIYNPYLHFLEPIEKYIDQKINQAVDIIHTNCENTRQGLHILRGFDLNKIKTIYTGINVDENCKKINQINNGLLTLKKKQNEIWVGMTGFLGPPKEQKYLIESIKIVAKTYPQIRCLIAGDGPDKKNLINLTNELNLKKNIVFTGQYSYNEVHDILKFLDIFVFVSSHEGFPYSVSEAMGYRLPIISTAVGGIPEQIEDGVNGLLIKKAESKQIAEKIIWLIENKMKWNEFGEKSYNKVKKYFSVDSMINEFKDLFN